MARRHRLRAPEASCNPQQPGLDTTADEGEDSAPAAALVTEPMPWPKDTVDQVRAFADVLDANPIPLSIYEIAARFTARGPWKKRLPKLLEMLGALGRAHEEHGRFSGR